MRIEDLDYALPKERIAQYPLKGRSQAKLLLYKKREKSISHLVFEDIINVLEEGDLLILNNSRVIKVRLFARRRTGARIEIFILERVDKDTCTALIRPWSRLKEGEILILDEDKTLTLLDKRERIIKFNFSDPWKYIESKASLPLPPYIKREASALDEEYYQTVFAKIPGSLAAHTAGLHFDENLILSLNNKGIFIDYITLHMSFASFRLLEARDLERENWYEEYYKISDSLIEKLREGSYNRLIFCGTSVVRAMESFHLSNKKEGFTSLFIKPGFKFKMTQALITNLHHPRSSHLLLLMSFIGREELLRIYKEALSNDYNFLSYGDAMLVI